MRRSWLKAHLTQTLIVHKTDDTSYKGVLIGVYSDGVALKHPEMLRSGAPPTELGGKELFIPREQIALAQLDQ